MPIYSVVVPFESLLFESLGQSRSTQLPESIALPNLEIEFDAAHSCYHTRLDVSASDITTAKKVAIAKVREILRLFAVHGDAFRVGFGNELTASRHPEESRSETRIVEYGSGYREIFAHDAGFVEMEGHLGIVVKRGSLDFERDALSWIESGPDWLRVALELNYLAILSQDIESAFLVQYAVLEILEKELLGTPISIFQSISDSVKLLADMRETMQKHGLGDSQIKRLINQMRQTHAESKSDRLVTLLQQLGIEASAGGVRKVVSVRGKVAHHGEPATEGGQVMEAAQLLRQWILAALKSIVSRRLIALPN